MATWGSGRVSADGLALEYACWGPPPGQAPTIALLHEGLGCLALWRDFPDQLAQATGLGVLAWSRAGYGHSDPVPLPRPLDYMTREAKGPVGEVFDALGISDVLLLGHSDGATIAAEFAGRVQDPRVRGLVLMAPHVFAEDMGLKEIEQARVAYQSGDLRRRLARYHADPDTAFCGWNDAWLDPGFRTWTVEDALGGIRVPTLAIQGRQDQYGTLDQIDAIQRGSSGPVETLILDGCRHAPQFDQADAVIRAVTAFAQQCLSPQQ